MLRSGLALNGWAAREALDQASHFEGTDGLLTGTNLPNNNVTKPFRHFSAVPQRPTLWPCRWPLCADTERHSDDRRRSDLLLMRALAYKGNNSDESGVETIYRKKAAV